jgi:AcrR family transcriptional regulator
MPDRSESRQSYHHGNLVEALIAATVAIIEEEGLERVSVREAAKRIGVSPGAPFRHFPSKTALMTAVAEQAMHRLTQAVKEALARAPADDPMAALEAIGVGYLRWALDNPTHFEVISSRTLVDFAGSKALVEENAAIRDIMVELLERARDEGQLPTGIDFDHMMLTSRALVYGLARMAVDGHFPEWHQNEPPSEAVRRSLALFFDLATRRSPAR